MNGVEIKNLTVEYASGDYLIRPVDGFELDVASGSLVVLLGPSGCGKTSLLSCLAGILTPSEGLIRVGDTEVTGLTGRDLARYRRHEVGVVFQAKNLVPSLNALENVEAPMRAAGMKRAAARVRAAELLDHVGMADRARHRPGQLSGGQQQRVAIARALANDPRLVLADEPTAHLDSLHVDQVLQALRDLAQAGRTVIVATHDARLTPLADTVVDLTERADATAAPTEPVTLEPGEVLFEQDDPGDVVYFVEKGVIELVRRRVGGGEEVVGTASRGQYFGELAPLLGYPRSATARARTRAVVAPCGIGEFRSQVPNGLPRGRRPRPLTAAGRRS